MLNQTLHETLREQKKYFLYLVEFKAKHKEKMSIFQCDVCDAIMAEFSSHIKGEITFDQRSIKASLRRKCLR